MSNPLLVRHVMMSNFKKLEGVTKVYDALAMMKEEGINAVLIQPRNEKDVYGIMTLKDIARKVIGERRKLHETHVYEIMSKPVVAVNPQMDIRYCTRLFDNFGLSRAPVIDNKKIVGLVSYSDIVLKGLKV